MTNNSSKSIEGILSDLEPDFQFWEKTKDLIDQLIDIILNYRQSGHPGGSRSKVHAFLTLLLSGTMRWDIRNPGKKFGDRFILSAGHTIPLVYCTLAVFNEALRIKYQQTGDEKYALSSDPHRVLFWEDLLTFRHRGGLSGHAEMEGKTLFLKFNTGPSGHGSTVAVGEALALKRAGAHGVRVFAIEGEGGLTPGANHESMNSAWGLKLDNLFFIVDWNDFGIDSHPISTVVYGTPEDWFSAHGWRVFGTDKGESWQDVSEQYLRMVQTENTTQAPSMIWTKTRKGREYLKYDFASHGAPHIMNSELFWKTKQTFQEKYKAEFTNFNGAAPKDPVELESEFRSNLEAVVNVLRQDQSLVDYLANRLVALGNMVPENISTFKLGKKGNPFNDPRIYDYRNYPANLYAKPGEKLANRAALAKWGAWVNAFGAQEYDQPFFIACSADLCESTNIIGFGNPYGDFAGYGWYERKGTEEGVLLPQGITEMANSGILAGMATVNFSDKLEEEFTGFWGVCSTYGSFSYLKYGMFRLFSQLAQDCQWKIGKVLWVVGHTGPETADDSRTHFGIFAPGVTQLFPKGHIINLHPWEYNEVPVLLGAALKLDTPIIALHLTRPPIEIPDREKLGIPSYFDAAKGAYIIRDFDTKHPHDGTFFVQGTSSVANSINLLRELEASNMNVKIVCVTSPELFAMQSKNYREKVITAEDKMNSTVITTQAKSLMRDWIFNPFAEEFAISPDWDDRWRTGGNLGEILDESHLTSEWILDGINTFVSSRSQRLNALKESINNLN